MERGSTIELTDAAVLQAMMSLTFPFLPFWSDQSYLGFYSLWAG